MSNNMNYCEYCGAQIVAGANFCEACGKQVQKQPAAPVAVQVPPKAYAAPAAQPARTPPPPAYAPSQAHTAHTAAAGKSRSSLWIILGALGCVGFVCVAFVAAGAIFFMRSEPMVAGTSNLLPTEAVEALLPTDIPVPEHSVETVDPPPQEAAPTAALAPEPTDPPQEPAPPEPPQAEESVIAWPGDIGQEMSDSYFTDDFSNGKFNWASLQEDNKSYRIEDGHYALHVLEEDFTIWAYLPTDFTPTTIGFDAAVQQGTDQGAFGVLCHYQDKDNYHFISIDPLNKEYSIGYLLNDEYITLMENMWMPSLFLFDSPYAVNNFLIACDPDMITLIVNNELEAYVSTGSQTAGRMAISAETWEVMSPNGYKVLFDNVFAYIQVQ